MSVHVADQQDQFKQLADESIDGVVISDTAGLIWYANPAFRDMSGFGERAIGSLISDYHSPANLPYVLTDVLPRLMAEGRWQGELEHTRPDGTSWLAQLSAVVLATPNGEPNAIGTLFRDVTLQRRRDREMRDLYQRLEQSFATSPLATVEVDRAGSIVRWSPAAERIFGWSTAEALGKDAFEVLVPNLAPEAVQELIDTIVSGKATNFRLANTTRAGRSITCQWHIAVMRDPAGEIVSWLAQTEDVTEQLSSIEALRQSEARNRALIEAIPDLMFLFNADGQYIDLKAEHDKDLIAAPEQLRNSYITDVLPPALAATMLRIIKQTLETRAAQQFEYQIMLGGTMQTFEGRTAIVSDQQVMMLARNITARIQAEDERNTLQEQVIATQQATLRELGTPIIPISQGVVAMPLVGAIDEIRAQQVIETLLEGVAISQAAIAILDITGVKVVDTEVANALLRAAQAVRMLGTQLILTGIKPEVAQTFVSIGIDLSGITTLATLENGITYALRRK